MKNQGNKGTSLAVGIGIEWAGYPARRGTRRIGLQRALSAGSGAETAKLWRSVPCGGVRAKVGAAGSGPHVVVNRWATQADQVFLRFLSPGASILGPAVDVTPHDPFWGPFP